MSAAILATASAIFRACDSDSITHGPAIKKNASPAPRRTEPIMISELLVMDVVKISQGVYGHDISRPTSVTKPTRTRLEPRAERPESGSDPRRMHAPFRTQRFAALEQGACAL